MKYNIKTPLDTDKADEAIKRKILGEAVQETHKFKDNEHSSKMNKRDTWTTKQYELEQVAKLMEWIK
jgi:hypothetical protein